MGSGRVIGELGFYLGTARTASVIADTPGVVHMLTRAQLTQIEQQHPEAASALHRLIIRLVAERATHLISTVNALQQ